MILADAWSKVDLTANVYRNSRTNIHEHTSECVMERKPVLS